MDFLMNSINYVAKYNINGGKREKNITKWP